MDQIGKVSRFTCPECQGALWEFDENGLLQFACRVGHSYTQEGLLEEHGQALEASLWAGVRALEENIELRRRIVHRFVRHGNVPLIRRNERIVRENEAHAAQLRRLLTRGTPESGTGETA